MKVVLGIFYFLLIMLAAGLLAALVAPSSVLVSRSVAVEGSSAVVFRQIAHFEQWEKWDPWHAADYEQIRSYSGGPRDRTQSVSWKNRNGELCTIQRSEMVDNKYFSCIIRRGQRVGIGTFTLNQTGRSTKVTTTYTSELGYPQRFVNYFMNKWAGEKMEQMLQDLKKQTER